MLVATIAEGRGAGKGWTVLFSGQRRLWVISGKVRAEQNASALPLIPDIALRVYEVDLKFLLKCRQARKELQIQNHTRIINLLVSL